MLAALVGGIAGVVTLTGPAQADVTVDPAVGAQGGAGKLTFRVTNTHPSATLESVELSIPDSMPIAEVYPLSVNDWAPKTNLRPLTEPMTGVHGSRVTDVVTSIVWIAVKGRGAKPGAIADLPVSLGPLPVVDQVAFIVTEKYSDGTAVRNDAVPTPGASAPSQRAAAVLKLIPNPAGAHGAETEAAPPAADDAADGADASEGGGSMQWWLVALGLIAGLVGGLVLARSRGKRGTATPVQAPESGQSWRYRESTSADERPPVSESAGKS